MGISFWIDEIVRLYFEGYSVRRAIVRIKAQCGDLGFLDEDVYRRI